MLRLFVYGLFAIFLLSACATHPPTANTFPATGLQKIYTQQQYQKLTLCMGMSDTAMYVAQNKLTGTPAEKLKKYYAGKDNAKLNVATVDRVYASDVKNAWDYTVAFFDECEQNLAGVVPKRPDYASYCLQNTLIADTAYMDKVAGVAKEKTYARFSAFKSKTPQEVIDKVFAGNKDRAGSKMEAWRICMDPLSEL